MALYPLLKKFLFTLDPETAHEITKQLGRAAASFAPTRELLARRYCFYSEALHSTVLGLDFINPVGLAAGFDKNCELVGLFGALGFGFTEVGSVTNLPSVGNPRPRLFRLLADEALINRMGLNNVGSKQFLLNLSRSKQEIGDTAIPIGVNVAKTHSAEILGDLAVRDIVDCYQKIALAADYVTLNVSCPNTNDGRTFESPEALRILLAAVSEVRASFKRRVPLLVKFSPDSSSQELDEALKITEEYQIDGYVLVNTTNSRTGLQTPGAQLDQIGRGGLSGAPLRARMLDRVRFVAKALQGRKPIIAVGGIFDADSAYDCLANGASLLQLYTGLVYRGPSVAADINRNLAARLTREGIKSIKELIGKAVI